MKKFDVTKEEMASAVKANGKEPWTVLGMKRTAWFYALKRNEVTMKELRSSISSSTSSSISKKTIYKGERVLSRKLTKLEVKMCEFVVKATSGLDEFLRGILSRLEYENKYFSKVLKLGK